MKKLDINVKNLKKIGEGGNGAVYQLGEDQIIKVYREGIDLSEIEEEKKKSKAAFVLGVPTAISFEVIEVENSYGIIFEMLNGKTIAEVMNQSPQKLEEYTVKFAALAKQLHSIEIPEDNEFFPARKEVLKEKVQGLSFLSDNQKNNICSYLDQELDNSQRFCLHCDLHTKNVFVCNEELLLIDVGDLSYGEPILDVANMLKSYPSNRLIAQMVKDLVGLKPKNFKPFTSGFMKEYYGSTPPDKEKMEILSTILILPNLDYPFVPEISRKRTIKKLIPHFGE